jgi:hypothetical protein
LIIALAQLPNLIKTNSSLREARAISIARYFFPTDMLCTAPMASEALRQPHPAKGTKSDGDAQSRDRQPCWIEAVKRIALQSTEFG